MRAIVRLGRALHPEHRTRLQISKTFEKAERFIQSAGIFAHEWEHLKYEMLAVDFLGRRHAENRETGGHLNTGRQVALYSIGRDLRYAWRILWRKPGVASWMILLLAPGIGATSAVAGILIAVLFHPFPYTDPGRLVALTESSPQQGRYLNVAPPTFLDWREQSRTLERMTLVYPWSATLAGEREPEQVQGLRTSPSLFGLLGARAALGRTYEALGDNERAVVLSYDFWQRQFGGSEDVLGRRIRLNNELFTVIGVMPREFQFPPFWMARTDFWAPLGLTAEQWQDRRWSLPRVFARLKPGYTLKQARAEMSVAALRQAIHAADATLPISQTVSLRELIAQSLSRNRLAAILVGIFGVLALLLAAAGIYGVVSYTVGQRRREIGIRSALGAAPRDILGLIVGQSMRAVLWGAAAGIVAALALTRVLHGLLYQVAPTDPATFIAVSIGLIATALLASAIPARRAARMDPSMALKEQ